MLIEPGDLEDLSVGGVRGGDLHVAPALAEAVLHVQHGRQPVAVQRFRVVQVQHDLVAFQGRHVRLEVFALVGAEFLRSVNYDHVAEDFGGKIHGRAALEKFTSLTDRRGCAGVLLLEDRDDRLQQFPRAERFGDDRPHVPFVGQLFV